MFSAVAQKRICDVPFVGREFLWRLGWLCARNLRDRCPWKTEVKTRTLVAGIQHTAKIPVLVVGLETTPF
jgi:hypothetical protein